MRIYNQNITVRKVLFSKPMSFFYFFVFVIFAYKSFVLIPIWLNAKEKAVQAEIDFEKKIKLSNEKKENSINNETDMGKERYQKEFFNKLDEGEKLIILYDENQDKKNIPEVERKMFWWQSWKQDFWVWWRNSEILKK